MMMNEVNEAREIVPSFDELADKALEVVKEKLEEIQSVEGISDEDRPIVEELARETVEDKVLEVIKEIKDESFSIGADAVRALAKIAHMGVTATVTLALTPIVGKEAACMAGEISGQAAEAAIIAAGDVILEAAEAAIVAVGDAILESVDKTVFSN